MKNPMKRKEQISRLVLIGKGLCCFLIISSILLCVEWFCYHHHKNIAQWCGSKDDPTSELCLTLEDDESTRYLRAGKIEADHAGGYAYMKDQILGEVKPGNYLSYRTKSEQIFSIQYREHLIFVLVDGEATLYYEAGTDNPLESTGS